VSDSLLEAPAVLGKISLHALNRCQGLRCQVDRVEVGGVQFPDDHGPVAEVLHEGRLWEPLVDNLHEAGHELVKVGEHLDVLCPACESPDVGEDDLTDTGLSKAVCSRKDRNVGLSDPPIGSQEAVSRVETNRDAISPPRDGSEGEMMRAECGCAEHRAVDAGLLVFAQRPRFRRGAEYRGGQRLGVAPLLLGHPVQPRELFLDLIPAAGAREPAIAILDDAAQRVISLAAEDDRRVWFLQRLRLARRVVDLVVAALERRARLRP